MSYRLKLGPNGPFFVTDPGNYELENSTKWYLSFYRSETDEWKGYVQEFDNDPETPNILPNPGRPCGNITWFSKRNLKGRASHTVTWEGPLGRNALPVDFYTADNYRLFNSSQDGYYGNFLYARWDYLVWRNGRRLVTPQPVIGACITRQKDVDDNKPKNYLLIVCAKEQLSGDEQTTWEIYIHKNNEWVKKAERIMDVKYDYPLCIVAFNPAGTEGRTLLSYLYQNSGARYANREIIFNIENFNAIEITDGRSDEDDDGVSDYYARLNTSQSIDRTKASTYDFNKSARLKNALSDSATSFIVLPWSGTSGTNYNFFNVGDKLRFEKLIPDPEDPGSGEYRYEIMQIDEINLTGEPLEYEFVVQRAIEGSAGPYSYDADHYVPYVNLTGFLSNINTTINSSVYSGRRYIALDYDNEGNLITVTEHVDRTIDETTITTFDNDGSYSYSRTDSRHNYLYFSGGPMDGQKFYLEDYKQHDSITGTRTNFNPGSGTHVGAGSGDYTYYLYSSDNADLEVTRSETITNTAGTDYAIDFTGIFYMDIRYGIVVYAYNKFNHSRSGTKEVLNENGFNTMVGLIPDVTITAVLNDRVNFGLYKTGVVIDEKENDDVRGSITTPDMNILAHSLSSVVSTSGSGQQESDNYYVYYGFVNKAIVACDSAGNIVMNDPAPYVQFFGFNAGAAIPEQLKMSYIDNFSPSDNPGAALGTEDDNLAGQDVMPIRYGAFIR